ncbi:hypothetical protein Sango_2970100 [Sesamum angolense]|uniref:Uncharacterized protein n=1 Tax=Sesamum angolense TaxID=2727404 RepID=A0AAE1T569_9LAMI|nr:hypothetical protein Sango_2970100 [Sesamum angolense]
MSLLVSQGLELVNGLIECTEEFCLQFFNIYEIKKAGDKAFYLKGIFAIGDGSMTRKSGVNLYEQELRFANNRLDQPSPRLSKSTVEYVFCLLDNALRASLHFATCFTMNHPDELLEVLKDRCFIRAHIVQMLDCSKRDGGHMSSVIKIGCGKFIRRVTRIPCLPAVIVALRNIKPTYRSDLSVLSQSYDKFDHRVVNMQVCTNISVPYTLQAPHFAYATEHDAASLCRFTYFSAFVSWGSRLVSHIMQMVSLHQIKHMMLLQFLQVPKFLCRLFHEERPVSHTIHCNALPKEEPKAEAEADSFRGGKITMVTDIEYSPTLNIEHAT